MTTGLLTAPCSLNSSSDIPKISLVYIQTCPEICNRRVLTRNRIGETIPIEYLKICHNYHEKWINNNVDCLNVLTIDGNKQLSDAVIIENIKKIQDYSKLC